MVHQPVPGSDRPAVGGLDVSAAVEHLEQAEASIMSFISTLTSTPIEEEGPDVLPVLLAVLRSVARAAGYLHAESSFTLLPVGPDPAWRCWRGHPPYCSSLDPHAHEPGYGCGLGASKQT